MSVYVNHLGLYLIFSLLQKQYEGGGAIHAIKLGLAETIESNADMKLELVYSVRSTILMQQTKQITILKVAEKLNKSVFYEISISPCPLNN